MVLEDGRRRLGEENGGLSGVWPTHWLAGKQRTETEKEHHQASRGAVVVAVPVVGVGSVRRGAGGGSLGGGGIRSGR